MSLPVWCDACKARVEWHVTAAGARMPIDPDAHPLGNMYFGRGLKLTTGAPSSRPRMYRCHWDTCAKGNTASKKALKAGDAQHIDQCERWACFRDPDDGHRHCFKCGEVDHFAPACPDGDR